MAQTREQNASKARAEEVTAATDAEAGLPFAAAAAFRTPNGSAAVTAASPGELSQTQTSITTLPDGTYATTVVTTTTVTTTTTTTTTTQTFVTGEMPPIMLNQLEAAVATAPAAAGVAPLPQPVAQSASPSMAHPAVQPIAVPAIERDSATHGEQIAEKPLGYRFVKRFFDIVFSAAVIVFGFIPGLILSLAIMISTKGSPFYVQKRVMKGGKEFNILKFRTMVADADNLEKYLSPEQIQEWHAEHKIEADPRITPLGSFLRKTSIDEFPNFLNVFAGQMSVVGPRAITKEELDWFGEDRAKLLSVSAGVTGWWQVSSRNDATFESGERQRLELYYVDHASLGFDIKVFFKTFAAVFSGTGK